VGQGHLHRLHRPGDTVIHRLPPQTKLVALFAFVVLVVLTPREAFWAFGAYALLLTAVVALAEIPGRVVARRALVEVPFVLFAVLLPFVTPGPEVEVLGLSLSTEGLLGAWNILAKATLGVVASIVLAATTEPRSLLLGLERLRLPSMLVQIASFMLRYADVILGEMERMRVARESRGFHARHLGQARVLAQSAGALFIRAYERGERVHLAMLSRGYTGTMPVLDSVGATTREWTTALVLPAAALVVAASAWVVTR
jgi:cobalt/nickel transport system permease protein